jgi:hypothetical protein
MYSNCKHVFETRSAICNNLSLDAPYSMLYIFLVLFLINIVPGYEFLDLFYKYLAYIGILKP